MNEISAKLADATEDVEIGELADSLGFLLRLAQLQIFEDFFEALSKHELKPGEFSVLWLLALNPGQRQGAIARRLKIKPAHMTKLIQRLESTDYLIRTIPDNDRRSVTLSLSKHGQEFVQKHKQEFFGYFNRDQERLSVDELDMLVGLLQKYVRIPEFKK